MSSLAGPVLKEFREEAATTRRVLERVPADKLAWKPHPKSMSLGQLTWHIATVPGSLARIVQLDSFDVAQANFNPPQPGGVAEIRAAYEQSVHDVEACLQSMTDDAALSSWRLMRNGREISNRPKIEIIRTIMLNHWYHHRGQLSVYLRLLNVAIPVIYGPSADENPFD